ncbi:hypothetical protein PF001_g18580 [Phytophthora fragariae]|uniref:Uncharacterized protein n=1 Tax=Phytophthora fragariae TaxID=53985 RepID=A0A6A4CLW4_9STRA|nr:hypothetical protein PF006_g18813 [Phytophthora fragariae]KAE9202881.1 hypothetical protein PF004_g18292 [Phytophthora fragariae]KAE9292740.1 hypothetical protein PF001_g18580 [Phytophthora fragariae]KAE9334056.1 hypothetical protein PF008_g14157 [Phytophthora fragariae]
MSPRPICTEDQNAAVRCWNQPLVAPSQSAASGLSCQLGLASHGQPFAARGTLVVAFSRRTVPTRCFAAQSGCSRVLANGQWPSARKSAPRVARSLEIWRRNVKAGNEYCAVAVCRVWS